MEQRIEQGKELMIVNFIRKDNHVTRAAMMLGVTEETVLAVAEKNGILVEK